MKKILFVLTATALSVANWAFGDTVHFKDGSSLDGVVSYPDEKTVAIDFGSGTMSFMPADVSSIEKNDKTGDVTKVNDLRAKQQQQALAVRTGMSDDQREEVREMMGPLWSPDEGVRNDARRKLLKMGKEVPVFQYTEAALRYSKGLVAPELLQMLVDLDPKRAKEVLSRYAANLDPSIRAKVLELMASYKDPGDLETIAGGIVDPDPAVRTRAAHALASADAKGATPALIKGLEDIDPAVQNASRDALQYLWNKDGAAVDLKNGKEWRAFWSRKAPSVKNAVDSSTLEPLVTPERLQNAALGHDE